MNNRPNRIVSVILSLLMCLNTSFMPVQAEGEEPPVSTEEPITEVLQEEDPETEVSEEENEPETTDGSETEEEETPASETDETVIEEPVETEEPEIEPKETAKPAEDDNKGGELAVEEEEDDSESFATDESDFTYIVSDGNVRITGYKGTDAEVVIPSMIEGKPVTIIGAEAFKNRSSLTSVTIPDSVTSIGQSAFYYCTRLTNLVIPDSVTSIDSFAFMGCSNLVSIKIPGSVTSLSGSAFSGCSKLKTAGPTGGGSNIEFGWTDTIPEAVFYDCIYLTKITVPDGITSIGERAFYNCSGVTNVTIPGSVTNMGTAVFSKCSKLKTAGPTGSGSNIEFGWTDTIPDNAFASSGISSITIPDSITNIGSYAFFSCINLTSINIPDSVTGIANSAFAYCSSLAEVKIPNSVTGIGQTAFDNCKRLISVGPSDTDSNITIDFGKQITSVYNGLFSNAERVIIPASVTSIESKAFSKRTSIKKVVFRGDAPEISGDAFNGDTLTAFYPGNNNTWKSEVFQNYGGTLTWEEWDTEQDDSLLAFNYITDTDGKLTITGYAGTEADIRIPSSINGKEVRRIGASAFLNNTGLTDITIPDSVKVIEDNAFSGCTKLNGVHADSLENWLNIDFNNEYANPLYYGRILYIANEPVTELVIPSSATEIKQYAFYNCTGLTGITVSSNLTGIGNNAFSGCSSLKRADCSDLGSWLCISFADEFSNPLRYAKNLYVNGELLTEAEIPAGTSAISPFAFTGCASLKIVRFPDSVTSIGEYAFDSCGSLQDVYYPGLEEEWNSISIGSSNEPLNAAVKHFHQHEYSEPEYTWIKEGDGYVVTAETVCRTNPAHELKETVDSTHEITEHADCETDGSVVYTAVFLNEVFGTQTKTEPVPATGHNYGEREYVWTKTENGFSVSAHTVCLNDNSHAVDETVDAAFEYIDGPGSEIVTGRYTADFADEVFETQTKDWTFANGVVLEPTETVIHSMDESITLIPSVTPNSADNQNVVWTSSDSSVVTVDENGVLTPINSGTAVVTVTTEEGGYTAECAVTVDILSMEISLDHTDTVIERGDTLQLSASVLPEQTNDRTVLWTSSNETVAAVDENGLVTALKSGETVITAETKDTGIKAECAVKVITSVQAIRLEETEETIMKGDTLQLHAEVTPEDADNLNLTWFSSDETIASVDANGLVTAVGTGRAVITVQTEDGEHTASVDLRVNFTPAEKISLDTEKKTLFTGDTFRLSAEVLPEDASDRTVYYESSDTFVVTVDESGLVTAIAEGNAVITAYTKNRELTAECSIAVHPAELKGLPYVIAFNGNGSTSGKMPKLSAAIGEPAVLTANTFVKKNYEFTGWNTKKDGTGDSFADGQKVENLTLTKGATVTLYAQWKPVVFTIAYELDGGENNTSNPETYTVLNTVKLASPVKPGYTFKGWYKDAKFKKKLATIKKGSAGDLTLYAKWTLASYTITYKLAGGKNPKGTVTKFKITDDTVTLPVPTRKGYDFAGWYKDDQFNDPVTEIPAGSYGNVTVYAKWNAINYGITYECYEGENNPANPETYTIADTVKLQAPAKTGYAFKGWYSDAKLKKKVTSIKKGSIGERTLYAKWAVSTYSVVFNANGGKGKAPKTLSCRYFETYALRKNTFTKTGAQFIGWNTEKDGSGTFYEDLAEVSNLTETAGGKVTLYAQWSLVDYAVTYELNGGTNAESNPLTYTIEDTVTFAPAERPGCDFAGWYNDAKYKTKVTAIKKGSTGNKTLYAKWTLHSYKISYELNGGTNGSNPSAFTVDTEITFAEPSRTGYTFTGWYRDAGLTEPVSGLEKGTMGDLTLYADWQANTYYIAFDANGGTGTVPETITATYDQPVIMPDHDLTFDDYLFGGWNLTKIGSHTSFMPGEEASNLSPKDGATVTVYANWQLPAPEITRANALKYGTNILTFAKYTANRTGYEIYRSISAEGPFNLIGTEEKYTTSHYDQINLKENTTYYYKVRAYYNDETGRTFYSDYSNTVSQRALKKPNFTGHITCSTSSYSKAITLVINNKGKEDIVFDIYNVSFYPHNDAIPSGCGSYGKVTVSFAPGKTSQCSILLDNQRLAGSSAYITITFEYDGATYSAKINRSKVVQWY